MSQRCTARSPDGLPDAAVRRAAAEICRRPAPMAIECSAQHYGWGDPDYIPALLGGPNPGRRPFAELWIGAHHDLPSMVRVGGECVPLDLLIAAAPEPLLGRRGVERFGPRLPFLMKVLAAHRPLSIQAHPNPAQARAGYAREEHARIPLNDPRRSYRDASHKPELLVALTEFFALRGFRPLAAIEQTLTAAPELVSAASVFDGTEAGLAALYRHLMRLPQREVNDLLNPLIERITAEDRAAPFADGDWRHWLIASDRIFSIPGRRDRGLLSLPLLNLIRLQPGQGIFLPAGELHSYLRGVGIELMANSNNVLRGGLTPKHIDVEALLKVLRFEAGAGDVLAPHAVAGTAEYRVPAEEFMLRRHSLNAGDTHRMDSGSILLGIVLDGAVEVRAASVRIEALRLGRGGTFIVPAACAAEIRCARPRATVYVAAEPFS